MSITSGHLMEAAVSLDPSANPLAAPSEAPPSESPLEAFEEKLTVLVQVGNELSKSATFDDLCRLAVEMGRACLGFDRLGLWFRTELPNVMSGSFGVDECGRIRDERTSRVQLDPGSSFHRILDERVPLLITANARIHDDRKQVVGYGYHAVAALWDGEEIIGCLSTDSFISGRPITERDGRLLTLFASTLGHLCTRQRAQEDVARKEASLRRLNEHLRHAMTETHHRVKNNLQIIAAMVDLQAMEHSEFVPTDQVYRLNSHVRTLALVHDILTEQAKQDGHTDSVSVSGTLARLVPLLERTSGGRTIETDLEDLELNVRQTTTLALLANELIGNALKHAQGRIRLRLFKLESDFCVEVRDEGPGFPSDFDPASQSHTGLELVRHLSGWDLGGEAIFANHPDGGAIATLRFPISNFQEPAS